MTVNARTIAAIAVVSTLAAIVVGFVASTYTPPPTPNAKVTSIDLSGFKIENIGTGDLGENIHDQLRVLGATDISPARDRLPAAADSKTILLFQDTELLLQKRSDPEFQETLLKFMYSDNAKFIIITEKSADVQQVSKMIRAQGIPADARVVGQFVRPLDARCSFEDPETEISCEGSGSTWSYSGNGDAVTIMVSMQEWLGREMQIS